jgi:hypothetical protein
VLLPVLLLAGLSLGPSEPGQAALLNVSAAKLTTQVFTGVTGTVLLRPNADIDGQTHQRWLLNGNSSSKCNAANVDCYPALRDGNDNTFIESGSNPSPSEKAQFQLDDAPSDLKTAASVKVVFRALKTGDRTISATVTLLKADNTPLASATNSNVGTSVTQTEGTAVGVSLTPQDVNGLKIEISASTSDTGSAATLRVTDVWVEVVYVR